MQKDPLDQLFSDDIKTIDRNKLADFLKNFIVFDRNTKEIGLLESFNVLESNSGKIEVILIASKARSLVTDKLDGLAAVEIIRMDIMPSGSVKSTLKSLFDAKKIKKDAGRYYIPNYRVNEIIDKYKV